MVVLFLLERVLGNGLECLLDVDSLLRRRLEVGDVALGLAPGHSAFLGDLQCGRRLRGGATRTQGVWRAYLTLALLHINLVPENNEGEVLRVVWACLNEELVPPAVECLKGLGAVDVVDEYAAVRATVEGNTQRLEPLLACRIPELRPA